MYNQSHNVLIPHKLIRHEIDILINKIEYTHVENIVSDTDGII